MAPRKIFSRVVYCPQPEVLRCAQDDRKGCVILTDQRERRIS